MKRFLFLFSFFCFFPFFCVQARQRVNVELVPLKEEISAQEQFYLDLKITLPPKAHIYWKNAGDSGESIDLQLSLPKGFKEISRQWQTPEKFSVSYLTEYGYQNTAHLLVKIKAPEKLQESEIIPFYGKVTLLVCLDGCIPMAFDVDAFLAEGHNNFKNQDVVKEIKALPEKQSAVFFENKNEIILKLPKIAKEKSVYFFPESSSVIKHSALQTIKSFEQDDYLFMEKAAKEDFVLPKTLKGVAVFYDKFGDNIKALDISAIRSEDALPVFSKPIVIKEFLIALVFAFIGGFLLNLMPCVFPILSLKAFRLLHSDKSNSENKSYKAGVFYTLGVLVSFLFIAGLLVVLKQAGLDLGWGFQLQSPVFVFAMCLLIFFLGLLFSDVVTFGENISAFGLNIGRTWNDFGTGVLAVFIATPCAAPFMGTALSYGLVSPALITFFVFIMMGLGMALPFLILDFFPKLARFLPKSGAWTVLLKHFLAFPLYATSAWLLWVLTAQKGLTSMTIALLCLLLMTFSVWLYEQGKSIKGLRKASFIVLGLFILVLGHSFYLLSPFAKTKEVIVWHDYNVSKIEEYRQAKVPVFVKFSAKWCLTCLVNEDATLSSKKVVQAFNQKGIVGFSADWTNKNDEITKALESYGRSGIPLYLYFAPDETEPEILPQILTPDIVLNLFKDL